jgi:RNA polymerase-interacting CarD/CdnL/TRCF family regulator
VAIGVGKRVVCPPYGIGTVARTLGALVENKPTPCFAVTIEVAGLVIERRGDSQFSMGEIVPGFEVVLPMDVAPSRLRELVGVPVARETLERLRPADSTAFARATFAERLHRIDHAMRSGSLDACAGVLCETLRSLASPGDAPVSFGERKAIHALERIVIGELALVLEEPADQLLEQVRTRFAG